MWKAWIIKKYLEIVIMAHGDLSLAVEFETLIPEVFINGQERAMVGGRSMMEQCYIRR
ncbi:MAG: hypothetical protein ACP5NL_04800 [Thermoplasmata archaeon]